MIPKEFFITSGKAASPVFELNAFDLALKKAEIVQCNPMDNYGFVITTRVYAM